MYAVPHFNYEIIFSILLPDVGPVRILLDAYRGGGVRGIFRGMGATAARDVPFNFVFFGAYEAWTSLLCSSQSWIFCSASALNLSRLLDEDGGFVQSSSSDRRLNPFGVYVAGGCAGATGWCVSFPMDSIKSRVQTSSSPISVIEMAKKIHNQMGFKGFYRGVSSAVLRAFPANAGLFLGYELTIDLLSNYNV